MSELTGWGRTAATVGCPVSATAAEVPAVVRAAGERGLIARGLGRSYGDPAQNAGGDVLLPLPTEIGAVAADGTVRVGAGTSLHDLMVALLPRGRFVPVTPGTRYVTVGGALACDVHGKSHHVTGSFGDQVVDLDLVLASGETRTVGPAREPELFWATVGGLGLTGVITAATLRTIPVETAYAEVSTQRLPDLDAVMGEMREGDADVTYSVAWIDTLARGAAMGRSVLSRGEHATRELLGDVPDVLAPPRPPRLTVPLTPPVNLVSLPAVRAFNEAWFRKAPRHRTGEIQSLATFFHPLDGIAGWNRAYGPHGFVQYQFVVPDHEDATLVRILERISAARLPCFLAVLKRFGPGNDGLLSFPMAGWTLAYDVPAHPSLAPLLEELDRQVVAAGGRVYLAKDSRLHPALLPQMYPRLDEFRAVREEVDPHRVLRSDLARRLEI
ncbi:FAD-binding oxidoreductase [Nocardioides mangrovi]|uniref:FAD-binding oxidoreductase n=1 Tax=Nocardioides mangrovi TaxID=2874580 RepID=A0ABS7U834_9ACTN|nr:FAD-binding oxidoreductase [Nocardioides mangrovi]MBZ5736873.1 FAD-binding oxidoreductase [Nocardioides mangrovi]